MSHGFRQYLAQRLREVAWGLDPTPTELRLLYPRPGNPLTVVVERVWPYDNVQFSGVVNLTESTGEQLTRIVLREETP